MIEVKRLVVIEEFAQLGSLDLLEKEIKSNKINQSGSIEWMSNHLLCLMKTLNKRRISTIK